MFALILHVSGRTAALAIGNRAAAAATTATCRPPLLATLFCDIRDVLTCDSSAFFVVVVLVLPCSVRIYMIKRPAIIAFVCHSLCFVVVFFPITMHIIVDFFPEHVRVVFLHLVVVDVDSDEAVRFFVRSLNMMCITYEFCVSSWNGREER